MIHQGQVQAYTKWTGRKVPLAVLATTDIVGEMALPDNSPHSATIEALEDTYAVPVTLDKLRESMRHYPETALTIIRVLVKKIRNSNNLLMNVLQGRGLSKRRFAGSPLDSDTFVSCPSCFRDSTTQVPRPHPLDLPPTQAYRRRVTTHFPQGETACPAPYIQHPTATHSH